MTWLLALLTAWTAISEPAAAAALAVTVHARALQPGELVVLAIETPTPVETLRVHAFGHQVPSFRDGPLSWRALVGIDLDVAAGGYPVAIDAPVGGRPHTTTETLVVAAHRFPTRTLQVDKDFVNPPPAVLDQIARDAAELAALWGDSAPTRLWRDAFVRPVPQAANSRFGTRSIFNGERRSPHGGADFLSPAGTPIKAPAAGRVVLARDLYFTGNTVIIDHGQQLFSTLAHLSTMDVRKGETVAAGQVVGLVGATGRVTGPHLHWAVRLAGARVDPLSVLKLLGE